MMKWYLVGSSWWLVWSLVWGIVACQVSHFVNGSVFMWDWSVPQHDTIALLASFVEDQTHQAEESNTEFMVVVDKRNEKVESSNENATFLVLCRNNEVYDLLETIQSIQDRYNHQYHHDWVFLNDKTFSDQLVVLVSSYIPYGRLSFGQVPKNHWSYPPFIDQRVASAKREEFRSKDVYNGDSESYRHMCRFYSGYFHLHPLVASYDYYWRVEPGVRFYCDVDYDVFQFMRENNKQYGFVLSMFEYRDTIPSLWETAVEFFESIELPKSNLVDFVRNPDGSYNLCHFWSNFEVAATGFFKSHIYNSYFEHLDRTGGFFYERWGDAPVHTLAVAHLLNWNEVWWFEDIGYYHSPYLHCPVGPSYLEHRCTCDQTMDFSGSELSCTPLMVHLQTNGGKLDWS